MGKMKSRVKVRDIVFVLFAIAEASQLLRSDHPPKLLQAKQAVRQFLELFLLDFSVLCGFG
jgi:hypothetical protein